MLKGKRKKILQNPKKRIDFIRNFAFKFYMRL